MGRYDDILNIPWPQPSTRPRMSPEDRAAQFAPFSALTGYGSVLAETARLTEGPIYLTEERLDELNAQLRLAESQLEAQPSVTMTVYYEDGAKEGGRFAAVTGRLRKIDLYRGVLVLADGREVPFSRLCDLEVAGGGGQV